MNSLATIFLNNLFPILLVAGIGYLVGKYLHVGPKSLSRVVFYIFSPCLIFNLLITSQLSNNDMFSIMGFAAMQFCLMGLIAWFFGRMFKLERKILVAVIMVSISVNAGNYGMSLNMFAFGESALAYAGLYFATAAILMYTIGITIASMGTANFWQSLAKLLTVPTVYAVVLAIIFNLTGWVLPTPLERSVSILADAAIPGMIIVLGLQLQHNQRSWDLRAISLATSLRLLGGMGLALATAGIFGLRGMAYNAGIIEASMPTAVLTTVVATEYNVKPAFVTSVVFITTILSPLTLTPLLAYLGA